MVLALRYMTARRVVRSGGGRAMNGEMSFSITRDAERAAVESRRTPSTAFRYMRESSEVRCG